MELIYESQVQVYSRFIFPHESLSPDDNASPVVVWTKFILPFSAFVLEMYRISVQVQTP